MINNSTRSEEETTEEASAANSTESEPAAANSTDTEPAVQEEANTSTFSWLTNWFSQDLENMEPPTYETHIKSDGTMKIEFSEAMKWPEGLDSTERAFTDSDFFNVTF